MPFDPQKPAVPIHGSDSPRYLYQRYFFEDNETTYIWIIYQIEWVFSGIYLFIIFTIKRI